MHQAVLIHPSELFTLFEMKIVVGMSQSELYCASVAAWPQQNAQPEERDKGLKKSTWPLCAPDTWDTPEEYQHRAERYRKGLTLTGGKRFQRVKEYPHKYPDAECLSTVAMISLIYQTSPRTQCAFKSIEWWPWSRTHAGTLGTCKLHAERPASESNP